MYVLIREMHSVGALITSIGAVCHCLCHNNHYNPIALMSRESRLDIA